MSRFTLSVLAVLLACGESDRRDQRGATDATTLLSTFEMEFWPGEGIPVFEAVGPEITLRESPSSSSIARQVLTTRPGQRLTFDSTIFRTLRPGRFVALVDTVISGRDLGPPRRLTRDDYYSGRFQTVKRSVAAGDSVAYLQYRAEGTCFVLHDGTVIDASRCPTVSPDAFSLVREPATEWWIRLVPATGSAGWVMVSDRTVRVVERTF
jgi:hypothetical protein